MTEIAATAPFDHIHLGRPSWVTGDIFSRVPKIGFLHAGEPWDFTRVILFEFQNNDIDDEHPEWMINWFAGVSLLRTVGHALRNVDQKRSGSAKSAIDSFWEAINADRESHWIFSILSIVKETTSLKSFHLVHRYLAITTTPNFSFTIPTRTGMPRNYLGRQYIGGAPN